MEEIGSMCRGDLVITDKRVIVRGMVNGDVIIEGASEVEITGMVQGSVRLRSGSASVQGMVGANVINEGGSLRVRGMVTGSVQTRGGTTVIEQGAMVGSVTGA